MYFGDRCSNHLAGFLHVDRLSNAYNSDEISGEDNAVCCCLMYRGLYVYGVRSSNAVM